MVLKARHYGVKYLAKASSRRILECVMDKPPKPSQPRRKKSPSLEVHAMFEPSRLAQQCLADAYARLIPTVHQRLSSSQPSVKPVQPDRERTAQ